MKKITIIILALSIFAITTTSEPLGDINALSWDFQDKDMGSLISMLVEIRRENDKKADLMLPVPYPNYQNLIDFSAQFNTSQLNPNSNFLKNLGQDVSGSFYFLILLIDIIRYDEIVLSTIYLYTMHRYPDPDQRLKVYQRIVIEEGYRSSRDDFDEDLAIKMLENESQFFLILSEIIRPK